MTVSPIIEPLVLTRPQYDALMATIEQDDADDEYVISKSVRDQYNLGLCIAKTFFNEQR